MVIKQFIKRILYFGTSYYCPVCNSSLRKLGPAGVKRRPHATCPVCGSLERHRMLWNFFQEKTNLFSDRHKKMLHIAPEPCFVSQFETMSSIDYLTADLVQPAMVQMDITNIQFTDNSFDVVYCSHVLEHVPDDRTAMKELARVLKPSGWAILQVPMGSKPTHEDLSITDPDERAHLYGQSDHVRMYGPDYKNRLEESGFQVSVIPYLDQFDSAKRQRYGFDGQKDDIYYCQLRT